ARAAFQSGMCKPVQEETVWIQPLSPLFHLLSHPSPHFSLFCSDISLFFPIAVSLPRSLSTFLSLSLSLSLSRSHPSPHSSLFFSDISLFFPIAVSLPRSLSTFLSLSLSLSLSCSRFLSPFTLYGPDTKAPPCTTNGAAAYSGPSVRLWRSG